MGEMTTCNQNTPLILAYDAAPSTARAETRIVLAYWSGVGVSTALFAGVGFVVAQVYAAGEPFFSRMITGVVAPMALGFLMVLPDTVFLGVTLWVKRKAVGDVGYANFRGAVMWGMVGGLFPLPLMPLVRVEEGWVGVVLLTALAWHAFYPMLAAMFLCFRNHVRD